MNYLKQFLLTVLVALVSFNSAFAYDFEVDGIYYNVLSREDKTCEVTRGEEKYSGNIVIPSTVPFYEMNFKVIQIGDFAFSSCYNLTSVEIPNSVTFIGCDAFTGCI